MLVKSDYEGDIRRFQVENAKLTFDFLTVTLASIYHITPDQFSLQISQNGEKYSIQSQKQFEELMELFTSSTLRVVLNPVDANTIESMEDLDLNRLFLREDFRRKLEDYMYGTYGLRPIKPVEEPQEDEKKNGEIQLEGEGGVDGQEKVEEAVDFRGQADEQQVVEEDEGGESDPENFVLVGEEDKKEAPRTGLSPPAFFRSIVSFIKGLKRENRPVQEEPVNIPNMEELLSRLEEMGFTNREANIESLKFHYKFNEGVDEVIEELLLSHNPAEGEKHEEAEVKEDQLEEEVALEQEDEKVEEEQEEEEEEEQEEEEEEEEYEEEQERRSVFSVSSSDSDSSEDESDTDTDEDTQSCSSIPVEGFPEGLNARDIVELMNRAGVTRAEAIRALKNQVI